MGMEPVRTQAGNGIAPRWVRELVRFMDDSIRIPGTRLRIGWDAILGFAVPWVGDAVAAASHVTLVWSAFRAGVPRVVFARMLLNAAIDAAGGSVPVLGDLFDAAFKANRRNLELIERVELDPARRASFGDYLFVGLVIVTLLGILLLPALVAAWVIALLVN